MTDEEKTEARNGTFLGLLIGAAVVTVLFLSGCPMARGDCLVFCHGPGCRPCAAMLPTVHAARQEGIDIRIADTSTSTFYRSKVRVVPTTIYVATNPDGTYRGELGRIEGTATAGQLRRLWSIPAATTVGASVRGILSGVGAFVEP
jgi:hypothetical protein